MAGNNLNCVFCHQAGEGNLPGTKKYVLPWTHTYASYPKFDAKSGKTLTLEERIMGMIGKGTVPVTKDSPEVQALVAYIKWLGEKYPAVPKNLLAETPLPARPANPRQGANVYRARCQYCHGPQGEGKKAMDFESKGMGYIYPPVAGQDTYDDGGHMMMIPLLTRFLYATMPFGATYDHPKMSMAEAYDVAAYINVTLPRKHNGNRDHHYPDPTTRPAGAAYREWFHSDEEFLRAYLGPFR